MAVRFPARRESILGGFVAAVAIAYALDLSFAAPFFNSGQALALYRRFLFIDHRIHYERRSDVYPADPPPVPAGLQDTVSRCRQQPAAASS